MRSCLWTCGCDHMWCNTQTVSKSVTNFLLSYMERLAVNFLQKEIGHGSVDEQ